MANAIIPIKQQFEFDVMHLCAGIGGSSLGFKRARYAYKGITGKFRNLVGIDVDESACKDYERITGSPAMVMDLFDRELFSVLHHVRGSLHCFQRSLPRAQNTRRLIVWLSGV